MKSIICALTFIAMALTCTAQAEVTTPAAATPLPQSSTPVPEEFSIAGEWHVTHPEWEDTITVRADGTFARPNGDGGRWLFAGDHDRVLLLLLWKSWGTESAAMISPDHFHGKVHNGEVDLKRALTPPPAPPDTDTTGTPSLKAD